MILEFMHQIFIINGSLIVWCLFFGGEIIKKVFYKIDKKKIPVLNVFIGVILMVFWPPAIYDSIPVEIRINRGIIYGLTSTGLHQLISNIIYWCKVKYYEDSSKDRRQVRNINI